ncbi:MAG TPA: hypothetical protein VFD77_04555 [Brumimicrobium sp.]|nr:hypothetical protein [Brumimicrobium sp.]
MMKKTIYVVSIILLGFTSCESEEKQMKDVSSTLAEAESGNKELKNEIVYSIPSPNEQYDLLRSLSEAVDPSIVNKLSNSSNYVKADKKALNFGVYLSDAAYLMRFEQGKKVFIDYLSTLDKLGQEIDITKVYGEELLNEVEKVGADSEKLFDISAKNYITIYDQLIENEKGVELSLILSGAWIETMYILFNSAGEYNENYEIEEYIVDQRYVLENLKGFIESYSSDERIQPVLDYFSEINKVYEMMDCEETSIKVEKKEGTVVLNGGLSCLFSADTYSEMKSVIVKIRTSIIS